jgi:hypothetical protein
VIHRTVFERCALAAGLIGVLCVTSTATAGVGRPSGLHAGSLGGGPAVPYLAWSAVGGADHYEIQMAADASFKALVSGNTDPTTENTRFTLPKTLPSHRYWWRVRAASKGGAVSSWSQGSFSIAWRARVVKQSSPKNPMTWQPVKGAAKYSVEISPDPQFAAASLVTGRPVVTATNSIAPPVSLPENTYYWRVTPLDAEGNPDAVTQPTWSFAWEGPASSALNAPADVIKNENLTDREFSGSPDTVYMPELSWQPVAGASRYEVEVNPDAKWAVGSKVCCDGTTAALRLTPTVSLLSNKYYWRVRGMDGAGNAGPWFPSGDGKDVNSFTKTFDNGCRIDLPINCLPTPTPSIANLHLEDSQGRPLAAGGTTNTPVIRWNAVPGASSYEYEVVAYKNGCPWGTDRSHGVTATTAWTPLDRTSNPKPYPDRMSVASETSLTPNTSYCMRVRAQTDRDAHGRPVYGDFTYLPNEDQPAFSFTSYPTGTGSGALPAVASVSPANGPADALGAMPIFTWAPVPGAASYWVIVARDASFTNIVDYAFTRTPAYAPRTATQPRTYPDESTALYWVVLPSPAANGACTGSACDPLHGTPFRFDKEVRPALLRVEQNVPQPKFSWNPVPGARRYELQVSQDPNFGSSFIEKITTVATSYTARITYPPGQKLFWRVRADDETLTGLTWSTGDSFSIVLPAPAQPRALTKGPGGITTLTWQPVEGAVSYDVHLQLPNGSQRDFSNLKTSQVTLNALTGTGAFKWQVRARFSRGGGTLNGPYSSARPGTQTVWQPAAVHTLVSHGGVVLSWKPVLYAKSYRVQISARRDFKSFVDSAVTDNPGYAPKGHSLFADGGRFYWRVAATDSSANSGRFTTPASFVLRRSSPTRPRVAGTGVRP